MANVGEREREKRETKREGGEKKKRERERRDMLSKTTGGKTHLFFDRRPRWPTEVDATLSTRSKPTES